MSVTQPCAAIKFRELDANGAPLAGGKLYTYAAGTTTPLASYTDYSGATPNANPVVLDAAGRADVWLQPGVLYKFVLNDSTGNLQYTEDNFPAPGAASSSANIVATDPGGRLTLTSGSPVTTGDVTGATSIYYEPYRNIYVPIYDGTNWSLQSIGSGLSQATADNTKSPAAVVANSNYDLYVWNDAGIIRLSRGYAWPTDTSRGSGLGTPEIVRINGRWVNKYGITNGPGANLGLYVGTVHSDGSAQINDSAAKRHVWNTHVSNRVRRPMRVPNAATFWTYSTNAWRQANGSTANQLDYVVGLAEDSVDAQITALMGTSTSPSSGVVAIGIDSTSTPGGLYTTVTDESTSAAFFVPLTASYEGIPGLGRHYLAWLEFAVTLGTLTWYGTSNGPCGIQGSVLA